MKRTRTSLTVVIVVPFVLFLIFRAPFVSRAQQLQATSQENRLFESAQADWNNQQFDQALQKYRDFVQLYPNSPLAPDAHFQIGYYLSYVASADDAIAEYQQTIALAPGTHDAHEAKVGIAALKFWQQDLEGAYDLFRQVLVETQDWAMIKECVFRMKELDHLIQLQKIPEQRNAMVDCGPKSLEIILEQKHIKTSDQEMRTMISLGQQGATMEQLKEASERKGLAAWGVKVNTAQLRTLPSPFIVHIRPDHFVVVTNATKDKIEFTDPHKGNSYRTKEKFEKIWQGYALVFAKDIPSKLRSQVLSKADMESIRGGHHLHGMNLGGGGGNPATKFESDPNSCGGPGLPHWSVNMSNYNFLVSDTDFSYSGRGPAVGVTRLYNADDPREGVFGRSWTFNYEVFLTVSPNGNVDVKREDGKVDNFMSRGDGTFDPPRWIHDQLIKNPDGTYKLILKASKLTEFFNAQGKLAQITDRNNNSVTLQYDLNNRLVSVTDAVGRITQFTYNAAGKVSLITDPIGRKASFSYDANNNLVTTTDMAGNVSTFTYNGTSYMTSLTTPNGTTQVHMGTTPHFTEFPGLLKDIVDPLGNTTRYDTGDFIAWVFDARGNQTFYFNDSLAQTTQIEDPLGNKTFSTFSSATGDLIGVTDPNGKTTNMTYDSRGNVTSILDALGNTTSFTYDSNNNVTQIIDPLNHISTYQYDAKGNVTKLTDAKAGVTTFTYDSFGQMTSLTDGRGNKTSYAYDAAGNLRSAANPAGGITTYTYDGVGRPASVTDPQSQTFTYTYDGIDRVTRITQPGGATTNHNYSCCKLSSITDSSGTLNFVYDAANRLIRFTNGKNQAVQYAYDEKGNLTTLTYPDGKVVKYEYDIANRLTKVTDWLSNKTTYGYDPSGNLISSVNSNGTLTGYQYDAANRLMSLVNARTDGSLISAHNYALNGFGNRTDANPIQPVAPTIPLKNVTATYDSDNRLLTAGASTYTHDANGNLTATIGVLAANYTYDPFNRLTQAVTPGQTAQYQYDGMGNRIARSINGSVTNYVVDPRGSLSHVLAESDNGGNITSYFVYGIGLIAKIAPTNQTYFYHYDGSGSTIGLSDTSGSLVSMYAYDSYGNLTNSTEAVDNPFRYAGQAGVMDERNGLLYMRARYYQPGIGRFINKDPVEVLAGLNLYAYVLDNPISRFDPTGFWYIDFNFSAAYWLGVTGGVMVNPTGVYPYLGGGVGAGVGPTITWSPSEPTQGWNVGLQGAYGVAGQVGYGFGQGGGWFWEAGAGTPGISLTGYYVWGPWKWTGHGKCQ